ncbi:hypothetical protein SRHO_G00256150 [Serrasalmus rhombeus]
MCFCPHFKEDTHSVLTPRPEDIREICSRSRVDREEPGRGLNWAGASSRSSKHTRHRNRNSLEGPEGSGGSSPFRTAYGETQQNRESPSRSVESRHRISTDKPELQLFALRSSRSAPLRNVVTPDSLSSLRTELKLQRSPAPRGSAGRGRCGLRQVQVKVSELGLGYLGQEELVFRYCSGRCLNSITNYDRILTRLAASRRSVLQGAPPTACCRPTAYERHLAFLDDDLLYHIVRKHSARRCGCV